MERAGLGLPKPIMTGLPSGKFERIEPPHVVSDRLKGESLAQSCLELEADVSLQSLDGEEPETEPEGPFFSQLTLWRRN